MPPQNPKNLPLQGAATDLGLGDMLGQQVQNETEEQRKKRMLAMQQGGGGAAMDLLGGAGGRGY